MASSMRDVEFESCIRKVVHEEMEQAEERVIKRLVQAFKLPNPRTSLDYHVETSQGIRYQLVFADKLPSTIFTDSKIEDEMDGPIKIELVDTIRKAIVTSGPLSSMKIKIVVLDGDLGFEDQENWTEQEFDAKIVGGRKDKRPLVIGDLDIALRDGVGIFNDLKFTDNSRWIRCGKFRLSARVVTSISGQGRIKEAISNAFEVKECRGKMYEKHYPPSLDDNVWRLEKIGKGGVYEQRLAGQNIHTVKDFKRMYKNNPNKLKDILKCPDGVWNTIVKHASTCVDDEKPNAVDDHNYQPPTKRRWIQEWQPLVESKNHRAYDLTNLQAEPSSTPTTGMHMGAHHASTSSSYQGGLEDHNHLLQLPVEKNSHPIQPSDPTSGHYNTGMEGLQAPCNEKTVKNLDYGMTSQDPMSICPPVNVNVSSYIQEPLVESKNHRAYYLTNLQAEPSNTPTTGMHMGAHRASNSSSYQGGLEDHNHLLQLPVEKNNHLIQPSDPTRGDYNIGMERLPQATCIEKTVTNLDYGMTSRDPMSNSPLVQSSDPICRDYNIRRGGLFSTEENAPSLAYGMTSQDPTSTNPSVTALGDHSNGSHLPLTDNDSEAHEIHSLIEQLFCASSEGNSLDDLIGSAGKE